jgi:uncharacterized protein YcbK (DUF882 family)
MVDQKGNRPELTRRDILIHAAGATLGLAFFSPIDAIGSLPKAKTLSFYHTHTGETFDVSAINGRYTQRDRKKLFSFLRDFRTGDTHPMDIRLFSTLMKIQDLSGSKGVFEVISGYRSPQTNNMLRTRSNGVAKSSYHMKGQAIDVRLSDVKTSDVRDIARKLQIGGVGYYKRSDFVHLDTGPVRFW